MCGQMLTGLVRTLPASRADCELVLLSNGVVGGGM